MPNPWSQHVCPGAVCPGAACSAATTAALPGGVIPAAPNTAGELDGATGAAAAVAAVLQLQQAMVETTRPGASGSFLSSIFTEDP